MYCDEGSQSLLGSSYMIITNLETVYSRTIVPGT